MRGPEQVVECRGTHYGMGLQQGEATRPEIAAAYRAFLDGPELEGTRSRWLPRPLHRLAARHRARRLLERPLASQAPEQVERMAGIARGGGIALDLLYLGLGAELLLGEVDWLPGACSALGVTGARSAGGEPLIAKNFDYPEPFRVGFCVRRNVPRDGLRSLDVTVAPLAGCHSGVNEAGLAITYNYGYGQDPGAARVPITLLVQRLLERCRTVVEAERLACSAPRAGGAIVTLADAGGDLAVMELSPTRFAVRRGELVAATNHYLAPETAAVDVPRGAVYGPTSLPALRGQPVHASSHSRLGHLERLGGERALSLEDLEAALRDHGPADRGDDGTLCRHGPYYRSTCAVVLLPAQRRLRVAFGQPCEQRFAEHEVEPRPRRARGLPIVVG